MVRSATRNKATFRRKSFLVGNMLARKALDDYSNRSTISA